MSNKKFSDTSAKKAAVTGDKSPNRLPLLIALAAFVLIAGGGLWYLSSDGDSLPTADIAVTTTAAAPAAAASSDAQSRIPSTSVGLPVATFDDGQAHYYQHHTEDGLTIRFFILKSSDGVVRAAFDACDVCWPANRGYAQEGDVMVCRNCARRFASVKINEIKGGCNPAPLQRRVENGMLILDKADILEGRRFFDFSKASRKSDVSDRAA